MSCPMDTRLARTPYLVIPKLAIQAMPADWVQRLEDLLVESEELGMQTPHYTVVPEGGTCIQQPAGEGEWNEGELVPYVLPKDPWANYKYGDINELCPTFKG